MARFRDAVLDPMSLGGGWKPNSKRKPFLSGARGTARGPSDPAGVELGSAGRALQFSGAMIAPSRSSRMWIQS
jgi:hypothetical protein